MIEFVIRSPHEVPCYFAQSDEDYEALDLWLEWHSGEVLGLDTETNAADPWDADFELRLIQVSDGTTAWLFEPNEYARHLVNRHPRFVAHFSEAEVRFLGRGLPGALRLGELEPHVLDYQVVQAVIEPRTLLPSKDGVDIRLRHDKGLKPSYARHESRCLIEAEARMHRWFKDHAPVGQRTPKASIKWGFRNIPVDQPEYLEYGAMDAVAVKVLYDKHYPALSAKQKFEVDYELLLQWDCDNMTFRGNPVDPPYVHWLEGQLDQVVQGATFDLARHGVPPSGLGGSVHKAFAALGQPPLKWNQNRRDKQTGESLPDTPSWDKEAMLELVEREQLAGRTPESSMIYWLAQTILDVRRAGKFRSTYVQPMLDSLTRDCRIHCSFRSIGTVTHRNSASDPPLQQQPKKDQRVRAAFGGLDGWVWVTCDLAQGEPRFMAGLSGDPAYVAAVQSGDVNNVASVAAFGARFLAAEGKVAGTTSYLLRQASKAGFLSVCYGAGIAKLASIMHLSQASVSETRSAWHAAYHVMFGRAAKLNTRETVELPSGREIILWDRKIVMPDGTIITSAKPSRKALNYETQGAQADWLKAAWLRLRATWNWALAFFLHDEIALYVPVAFAEQAAADLHAAMVGYVGNGVHMEAEAEIVGPTWLPQPATFDRAELESVDV